MPDTVYGEAVFAVIIAAPGASRDDAALMAHCREHIGGYKIPRRFAYADALPKSALGKVLKAELRAKYAGAPA